MEFKPLRKQNLLERNPLELQWQPAEVKRDLWSPAPGQALGQEGWLQVRLWISAEAPRLPPHALA